MQHRDEPKHHHTQQARARVQLARALIPLAERPCHTRPATTSAQTMRASHAEQAMRQEAGRS
eukprot:10097453-Lingulodinium_polyedra.AAC.1